MAETPESEQQLNFLMQVLKSIDDSKGDSDVVYPLFRQNLALLNDRLIDVLKTWASEKFAEIEIDRQKSIALDIIDLGNLIQQFLLGDKAVNMDFSIGCYEILTGIFTTTESPKDWAQIQNSLATAYSDRIRGDRAENLELAISGYELALEIYTKRDFPTDWAMIQNNRASAYNDRIVGNKAQNLELAIASYESALEIYTEQDFPIEWGITQNNRASAYNDRIMGDRAENLELALAGYESALRVRTKQNFPLHWAATQNNRANAYSGRIRGGRAKNLELAIAGYQSALEIYTRQDSPLTWAATQNNLASAYNNRIMGSRAENLELAIAGYQSALEIYTEQDFPLQWAITQNNRANVYNERIIGSKEQNLEEAIAGYESTLKIYTKRDFPVQWATTQNNWASAYSDRIMGNRAENLELAIAGYESALEIRTKIAFPLDWAMTQNNYADAYRDRIMGDRATNLELAIAGYESALEIRTPQALPIECLRSARNLGDAYLMRSQWQQAVDSYEIAMQAAETSRRWSVNDVERQLILENALSVYENAIQCTVNLKDYKKGVEYTDRVRSRLLVELMASNDLYGEANVTVKMQAYLTEYEQLNEQIEHLRESNDRTMSTTKAIWSSQYLQGDREEKISSLADRKQILYDKIRTHDPVLAGQIAIAPISHSEIQKLITNAHTAILTCYSTNDHTHIFILKQNQESELFTCTGQGWNEFQQWLIENWLKPYKQEDNSAWRDRMPLVLAEIAERLQLPQLIANHLSDIQELVLVPHLLLHQIPFAALPTGNSEELLGDRFIIRSIPSCQILKYCQDRSPILSSTQGIVEDADDSLLGARYEGQKITEIHGVREIDRLRGKSQATIANYRQLLARVNRLHSSHHASSNLENPLESALFLADGKITLGDLLMGEKYPNLDEIFLSACETHLGKFTFTDDVATLTTGFLCIGARSVQSTLWSVDDLVTALFDIFYHEARRDLDRARSLQAAQKKLRHFSGEEFKLYHFPTLIEYVTADSSARIAALKQQMKELHQQKSTLNNQTAEWQQISITMNDLSREVKSIESSTLSVVERLNRYGESDRPFESPFYWAGFICQGMA